MLRVRMMMVSMVMATVWGSKDMGTQVSAQSH